MQSLYDSFYLEDIMRAFGYVNPDSQLDSDPVLNEPYAQFGALLYQGKVNVDCIVVCPLTNHGDRSERKRHHCEGVECRNREILVSLLLDDDRPDVSQCKE